MNPIARRDLKAALLIAGIVPLLYLFYHQFSFPAEIYLGPSQVSLLWPWPVTLAFFWMLGILICHFSLVWRKQPRQTATYRWFALALLLLGGFLYGIWDLYFYFRRMFEMNAEPVWPALNWVSWGLTFITIGWTMWWLRTLRRAFSSH